MLTRPGRWSLGFTVGLTLLVFGAWNLPIVFAQIPAELEPGDSFVFVGADAEAASSDCGDVNRCGYGFEDLGADSPRMTVFTEMTAGAVGLRIFATARLLSFLAVSPGEEHRIGAKLNGLVSWRGWLLADFGAADNDSTVDIAVAIFDITEGADFANRQLVARQTLYSNSVSGQITAFPTYERAIGSGSFNLAVDLFRGHVYMAMVEAICRSSSGLAGISTASSFTDVDLDVFPRLHDGYVQRDSMMIRLEPDYLEMIENLREDFQNHRHLYRTGRGKGHNNTRVETGPALD